MKTGGEHKVRPYANIVLSVGANLVFAQGIDR